MTTAPSPLISVVLAAHDAERFVRPAVASVLRQTFSDLELIVVDDGSQDRTPELLADFQDPRLVLLRSEERQGLATSLNLGLDHARGRYVARLDADDVAMPNRLTRQLARIRTSPGTALLGSSVCELGADGRPGTVHAMPTSPVAVRWHLLFSSPFFHPTVLVDRELLERERLRYDPRFLESEDYDLWTRVLELGTGTNETEPLVLYRVHPGQASQSRRDLQRTFQLEIARREIACVSPDFSAEEAELAWSLGVGERLAEDRLEEATSLYVELARTFESRHPEGRGPVREAAARALMSVLRATESFQRADWQIVRRGLGLDNVTEREITDLRAMAVGVTGDMDDRDEIVNSFAPFYRIGPEPPAVEEATEAERVALLESWQTSWIAAISRPIDVLLSTDVLAEGVNLQDASVLVNYDVHWNPVRMIQRSGRIDRRLNPRVEDPREFLALSEIAQRVGNAVPKYYWHEHQNEAPVTVNMILPDQLEHELQLRETYRNEDSRNRLHTGPGAGNGRRSRLDGELQVSRHREFEFHPERPRDRATGECTPAAFHRIPGIRYSSGMVREPERLVPGAGSRSAGLPSSDARSSAGETADWSGSVGTWSRSSWMVCRTGSGPRSDLANRCSTAGLCWMAGPSTFLLNLAVTFPGTRTFRYQLERRTCWRRAITSPERRAS